MSGNLLTAPALLDTLYEGAVNPQRWPDFLNDLAGMFHSGTASIRVTDRSAPVVLVSHTVGFDETVDHRYRQEFVAVDPFREHLSAAPLGAVVASHAVLPDREYEDTEHYQQVFRPNGNFYAMGAQFERSDRWEVHIGVHRARKTGPFGKREQRMLALFSPHLRRAARLMRLVGEFELAVGQAHAALNQLPFGVWLVNRRLHCRWMNAAAEDAVRTGIFGLGLHGGRLSVRKSDETAALRAAAAALRERARGTEVVRLGLFGASLILVADRKERPLHDLGDDESGGILVFLLDPERPALPDAARLRALYALTPAEIRLLGELLRGLDLGEASACLGVSTHTARSQLKSAMQKTGAARQADLIRKLLLGCGSLRPEAR